MEANKILSANLLDIIFDGRNKSYGAYELRKTYSRRILKAIGITLLACSAVMGGALLANRIKGSTFSNARMNEITLEDIQEEKNKLPIPPPLPPPAEKVDPPKMETIEFKELKVVQDNLVEKPPPEQSALKDVRIDVMTQDGVKDQRIVLPPEKLDEEKGVVQLKREEPDETIFCKVEIEASFKGGEGAWRKYLERKLNPNIAIEAGAPNGLYQVIVQFVVDKMGRISDVKALTNHGFGMEKEAIRVIQSGPNWEPAQQNGSFVNAYRKQPITFQVTNE